VLILDSNVLSELLRPKPNSDVVSWLEAQPRHQLYTTSITRAEILYGVSCLPRSSRRQKLWDAALSIFNHDLAERVLSFDGDAADRYAEIAAARRSLGKPISQLDAMIASITRVHRGQIVTRNLADFQDCGVGLVNPWKP
jgi:toxin FitB